jgi:hypothetical protein
VGLSAGPGAVDKRTVSCVRPEKNFFTMMIIISQKMIIIIVTAVET